ncbi:MULTISPECIES: HAMP domain-containing methyl-accepting chemotaxis protein [unclassified Tolypothrix]|uniref:HAMP domain-containing methyl-accepting chemotaxis protein n=1 Tax=unclassified Tolypothrix TaxID=2649714 RepID=UPI0005EAB1D9|nr:MULTISPECIES: methyl-accepting chemotaxis protein [unclassified Tolypothrix]BAY91202.1 methyl-accepting chemotaxis sensory transducer [Microchaete diplosiphon NIES-3275]EKF00019.1 methyl-accepting chemotaxis sensory transducer [Tolypothrix sp. PCC 7601]MBE9080847.1 methyl-accepting chemotaxis protein [Tolypothrix sp. LEGE 11397]UYD25285.1 methyl-accepting chemotaxis protein [Tolypothrix sp. PCC 7712]UYD32475.1 methyl-accepting chemotaxis protein [Tolypothrix sp. PCC 7601]
MVNSVFKDPSLQGRIMSAFMLMGALVFFVALVGFGGTFRLSSHIDTLSNNSLPSLLGLWKVNEGQTQIESSERALLVVGLTPQERQAELTRIKNAWGQIDNGFKQYESTPRTAEEDRAYKKLQDNWNKWKNDHEEFLKLNQQFESLGIFNPYAKEAELLSQKKETSPEMATVKKAVDALNQLRDRTKTNRINFEAATTSILDTLKVNESTATIAQKESEQDANQSKFWTIVAMFLGPAIAIILGRFLSKALVRRIQKSVVQITTSATQIAASGKELEATVAEQVASTNEVSATATEIAANSRQLVRTMEQVAEMTQATAMSASHSKDELANMETVMRQLTEATNSISSKLGVMNNKAGNINNVVVTITKVADQTSILSLNAAIEAEKAGEYGAGFAVVAREIRRLANQTAVATLEIEQIVKDMQSAVTVGVMEMDKFNKSVSDSVDRVSKISFQVEEVISKVQSLPPQFEQVSQSMEEQSEGAQQISLAMEQLSEASAQTVDALRETNNALEQLDDAARGLRNSISSQN